VIALTTLAEQDSVYWLLEDLKQTKWFAAKDVSERAAPTVVSTISVFPSLMSLPPQTSTVDSLSFGFQQAIINAEQQVFERGRKENVPSRKEQKPPSFPSDDVVRVIRFDD
jgi:hypothetical protein